jgi:Sugar (and other) transporter.
LGIKDDELVNDSSNETVENANYLKRAIFTFTAWFLNDLIFYGIGIYTSVLLLELGYSGHAGSLELTLILYLIGVIGTLSFVFTADRFGRKSWQAYTFLAQGLALGILGTYYLLLKHSPPLLLLFPMFAIFYFANAGGTGETTGIFVSELFPTRMRTTAMGAGTAISRVGAIISAVLFPIMLKIYGIAPMEFILFAVGLAGFIITVVLGEETKNKSLETLAR